MGNDIENQEICASKDSNISNEMSKDSIANVIGEFGKWQVQKIALVFLISVPGLAMIFSVPFVFYKTKFECVEPNLVLDGIPYNLSDGLSEITGLDGENTSFKTQNQSFQSICEVKCNKYGYDQSFWHQSVIMEWDLVCENSYLLGNLCSY